MEILMRKHCTIDPAVLLFCCALSACSDDGTEYPYAADTSTVIGASIRDDDDATESRRSGLVGVLPTVRYATPGGDDCIELRDRNGEVKCLRPQKNCGDDGTSDVIVDEDGQELAVICYPNRDYAVQVISDEPARSPVLGNNSVIVLDGDDDGADIEGDLLVEGNNVIVYGEGPESSVIAGDLLIEKNNTIVRGVRVEGDVRITKNNASLVYCAIEGDLTISGNNVNLALCEVWGRITIEGNNAVFVSNLVGGDQTVAGKNLRCNDNQRFSDSNGDGIVDDDDVLTLVTCGR
jgi:hypothetical protein